MHSINQIHSKPYHVDEISINSRETHDLLENINLTNIDSSVHVTDSWQLQKAFIIQNKSFEREFNEKREEIQDNSFYHDNFDVRFGFLSATNDSMIYKLAEEGMEIKMNTCNYLGHNTSGIHISMNVDVCLNEAQSKMAGRSEITLLIFKYMLGKRKMVAMHNPKILIAPTPIFDSHVCEERPIPTEKISAQYIKSLVYLYEFANDIYDPVIRPRHCCPIGALIFTNLAPIEILDLTETDSNDVQSSTNINQYPNKPRQQLSKPNLWVTQFLTDDKDSMVDNKKSMTSEDWRPIKYTDQFPRPNADSMLLKPQDRDSRAERNKQWKDGISIYGGVKYSKLLNNRSVKPYFN